MSLISLLATSTPSCPLLIQEDRPSISMRSASTLGWLHMELGLLGKGAAGFQGPADSWERALTPPQTVAFPSCWADPCPLRGNAACSSQIPGQSLQPRVCCCLICLNLAQQWTGSRAGGAAPCGVWFRFTWVAVNCCLVFSLAVCSGASVRSHVFGEGKFSGGRSGI